MGNLGATELILLLFVLLLVFVPYVWSIVWAYRDAERRCSWACSRGHSA